MGSKVFRYGAGPTLFAVLLLAASAAGQEIVLGILEENRGWYYGDPNFRDVRVVFAKSGSDWKAFPSDCPDQHCLKATASNFPQQMTWTITFDGRKVGEVTTRAPESFKFYAAVGQEEIIGAGIVPTIGDRSEEFGDYPGSAVSRPLVANSKPFFKDPERWKPYDPPDGQIASLQGAFRKQFPSLCRLDSKDETKLEPYPYRDKEIRIVKAYLSNQGWAIARLHLQAIDCKDVEADSDLDDPWFVMDAAKSVRYLDSGMWLVDAGDYGNDGESELVFSIDQDNRGGYTLFYDHFQRHATFSFSYH